MASKTMSLEEKVRVVSDMWEVERKSGRLYQDPQYQAALRATAHWPRNPAKTGAKNAVAPVNDPRSIRNVDPLMRKVSDLRDLCNQAAPLHPTHGPKIAAHSIQATGSRRPRESNKIPPAPIIRRHRPGK
jgi:hypothetical protein